MKSAVLLVNLGSPDSPSVPDVRRYLREFLSDPRVLDGSAIVRQTVLNLFILPTRPRNTAHAYQSIWTQEGSPLVAISQRVQKLLQEKAAIHVELAMRYGNPSIPNAIRKLVSRGIKKILLLPLYPHYAMSSFETVEVRVREELSRQAPGIRLVIQPPFYEDPDYIRSLVASAEPDLRAGYDHLLFSFHGLPEHHLKLSDPSKSHCMTHANCCATPHPCHATCYRAQSFRTMEKFVQEAGIPAEKHSHAFQSRLGRQPWLRPYTDLELQSLPARGVKKLLVLCPSFVSDCLETLEEIAVRGKQTFVEAGGSELKLIPCLNEHPLWIETLAKFVHRLDVA